MNGPLTWGSKVERLISITLSYWAPSSAFKNPNLALTSSAASANGDLWVDCK